MNVWSRSPLPVTRRILRTSLIMSYIVWSFTPPKPPFCGLHHGCLAKSRLTALESIAKKPFKENSAAIRSRCLSRILADVAWRIISCARPQYIATYFFALALAMLLRLTCRPMPILYSLSECARNNVSMSRRLCRDVNCAHIITSRCFQQLKSFT